MGASEKMAAEWECQQLLSKVIHLLDQGRWHELAACFTEDASFFRPSDPDKAVVGRSAILEAFSKRPPKITTHLVTNCWFEEFTGTELRSQSRVLMLSGAAVEQRPAPADPKLFVGDFSDRLRKSGDTWLIAERRGKIDLAFGG